MYGAFWSSSRFILYSGGAGEEREQKEIKGAGMHLTFMLLISRGIGIYHEHVAQSNLQRTP